MKTVKTLLKTALFGSMIAASSLYGNAEFDLLKQYVVEQKLDMDKAMDRKTWIPDADGLVENISDYFILDIRSGDVAPKNGKPDFEDGHIPGAHNTTFENVLNYAREHKAPDRILVVSEDGQAAAAAAVALRMAGYPNTKTMKFGMAGWNKKFDVWSEKRGNLSEGHKNWTKEAAPAPKKLGETPALKTGKKTGKEILEAQVQAFLKRGFQAVQPQELLENPNKYFVVNQGNAKAYGQFGRVAGSQQFNEPMINPKDEKKFGSIEFYPADKPIVQYCWSGHAAITVASWLNILGYDAKGTAYGTNALFYDKMTKAQFKKPEGYGFVTGK
ncbi:MAG: rhodanese-like domain-containing protein [Campylobacterales bacterium]|nr:rhodanese-like domain-containing protein [Campylobacterales bacterium]